MPGFDRQSADRISRTVRRFERRDQNIPARRGVRFSPTGGSQGLDRAIGRATENFDVDKAEVVVDNISPTKGLSPTEQASDSILCKNRWKLAGKNGDDVAIEFEEGTGDWIIYQATHRAVKIVKDVYDSALDIKQKRETTTAVLSTEAEEDLTVISGTECT